MPVRNTTFTKRRNTKQSAQHQTNGATPNDATPNGATHIVPSYMVVNRKSEIVLSDAIINRDVVVL